MRKTLQFIVEQCAIIENIRYQKIQERGDTKEKRERWEREQKQNSRRIVQRIQVHSITLKDRHC